MKGALLTAVAIVASTGFARDAASAPSAGTPTIGAPSLGVPTILGAPAQGTPTRNMPTFGSLPEGHVGFVPKPKAMPRWIGPSEKVPGLFVAWPPKEQQRQMRQYGQPMWVSLFGSAEDARRFSQGDSSDNGEPGATCFTTADRAQQFARQVASGGSEAQKDQPLEWPSSFEGRPTLMGRQSANKGGSGGITAVHEESLARDNAGRATLTMTDAWVDPDTRGARLIGTSSMQLVRVATAPSGIEVYAARNGDDVEFVVTGPQPANAGPPDVARFLRQFSRMNASLGETRARFASSDCGHLRLALRASDENRSPQGVVQTTALLPPIEKDVDPKAPADPKDAAQDSTALARAFQSIRKRPINISLSTTRVSGDKEPVLSVGIGWAGRESRQ
jgi:hypothetical protein